MIINSKIVSYNRIMVETVFVLDRITSDAGGRSESRDQMFSIEELKSSDSYTLLLLTLKSMI